MPQQSDDIIRVLRLLEYVGPREFIEHTIKNSIHGRREFNNRRASITSVTLGDFPEVVQRECYHPSGCIECIDCGWKRPKNSPSIVW